MLWLNGLVGAGTCNLVTASGSSLIKGADLTVNAGNTRYLAVSALSSGSAAVVCYSDGSNSYKGVYERLCV